MDYDFSKIFPEEHDVNDDTEDNDPRTNFRIAACCRTCIHFKKVTGIQKAGLCTRFGDKDGYLPTYQGKFLDIDKGNSVYRWYRTHENNVCDEHPERYSAKTLRSLNRFTGNNYGFDGNLDNEVKSKRDLRKMSAGIGINLGEDWEDVDSTNDPFDE